MSKKRSGNPKTRAAALAAATERKNPCPRCPTGERHRSAIGLSSWCLTCSDRARKRGMRNRPSRDAIRRSVIGVGVDLGICTPDGTLIEEPA